MFFGKGIRNTKSNKKKAPGCGAEEQRTSIVFPPGGLWPFFGFSWNGARSRASSALLGAGPTVSGSAESAWLPIPLIRDPRSAWLMRRLPESQSSSQSLSRPSPSLQTSSPSSSRDIRSPLLWRRISRSQYLSRPSPSLSGFLPSARLTRRTFLSVLYFLPWLEEQTPDSAPCLPAALPTCER